MKSIGIRAAPKVVYYTIAEKKEDVNEIVSVDSLLLPVSMFIPDKLNYLRKTFIDIINLYDIERAGIRVPEGSAQKVNIHRTSNEAVIQELFSGSSINKYYVGNISKISRLLKIPNNGAVKKMIGGQEYPSGYEFLNQIEKAEKRESAIAALAALNL